jgi:DNA-binding transcriptional LysR family regulator
MKLSLGCLQAFLAVADHLDYRKAAEDLGVSSKVAKDRVGQLEAWLHKVLILDDPIELNEADGLLFVPIAFEILQRFESACHASNNLPDQPAKTPKAKQISRVRLNDLESFLSVASEGSYKGAADLLNCNVTTVQRSIRSLQIVTGQELISGRSVLTITEEGQEFRHLAEFVTRSLQEFRGVIPPNHDTYRESIEQLYRETAIWRSHWQAVVTLISNSGKTRRGKIRLQDAVLELEKANALYDKLIEHFGPFGSVSGPDVVIGN